VEQSSAHAKPPGGKAMSDVPSHNPYAVGLDRDGANFVPLSPLGFIARSAAVHPDRAAVLHGDRRYSWAETYRRCRRLALKHE